MTFICILILFGCSTETIQQLPISQSAADIKSLVNQSQWEQAKQEARQIKDLYNENKWKYQLIGDETEYSKLDEAITKLHVSIDENDTKETKLNIAAIEHYIEALYFK
jgi:hypothetical protein